MYKIHIHVCIWFFAHSGKHMSEVASALTALGHIYTATGDLKAALRSHKKCFQLVRELADQLAEAREIGKFKAN